MPSKLEDILLRGWQKNDNVRTTLFDHLDDGTSLHNLRAASRPLKDIVDQHPDRLWRNLYTNCPLRPDDSVPCLEQGAEYCQHLTIIIGFNKDATNIRDEPATRAQRASKVLKRISGMKKKKPTDSEIEFPYSPDLPKDFKDLERLIWRSILRNFVQLQTLTIRVNGHPAWRGRDEPERTLLLLRLCLENADISNVRTINLHPIHGMGILHLRWASFGAFTEVPNLRSRKFWQNITNLSIHLRNPLAQESKISGKQYITFLKCFNDYLRSHSRQLCIFKFIWLDREGPNPLSLHEEVDMENQKPIPWGGLDEFWFGNLIDPNKVLATIPDRAPGLDVVKILRSTHQDSNLIFTGEGAWMTIPQSRIKSMHAEYRPASPASSIYSRSSTPRPTKTGPPAINRVSDYDPANYPSVDIKQGRAALATSAVYGQANWGDPNASGMSTQAISDTVSLNTMDDDEAPDPEERPATAMKMRTLLRRRLLATESVLPPGWDPYKSGISTAEDEAFELDRDAMKPAPLGLGGRRGQ